MVGAHTYTEVALLALIALERCSSLSSPDVVIRLSPCTHHVQFQVEHGSDGHLARRMRIDENLIVAE